MNAPSEMNTDSMIADSVGRLFSEQVDKARRERAESGELDADLWRQVSELGLTRLTATEAAGGLGEGWAAAYPILRGLGHWQVPLPLAETMIAAQLASLAGLPLPDGPLTLLEAGRASGSGGTLQVSPDADSVRLSGTAHRVPWARCAQAVLVSLPDGRLGWLGGESGLKADAAVRVQPGQDLARLPSDSLVLEGARLGALKPNPVALAEPVWHLGALAQAAMLVGALESALEMAVRYAGERVQFGQPIGKFQAVQQNLALMAGDVAGARVAALVAAQDAPWEQDRAAPSAAFSIAVAKVRAGEAATRGASIAHQVHGAIGFTVEHGLHFATRRLWSGREAFGSDADWAAELGRQAIAARAAGFWPGLTQRRFG